MKTNPLATKWVEMRLAGMHPLWCNRYVRIGWDLERIEKVFSNYSDPYMESLKKHPKDGVFSNEWDLTPHIFEAVRFPDTE